MLFSYPSTYIIWWRLFNAPPFFFLFFLVLWLFQLAHAGRLPQAGSQEDMDALFKLRDERLKSAQVDDAFVNDELLQ